MIRTILVDDELRLLKSLELTVGKYCPRLEVVATCLSANDAIEKIKTLEPDLVLMDISMPGKNAFDILNELSPIQFSIIFITAHQEHSLQAIKYSAVDYLLKPLDESELIKAVNKAETFILEKKNNTDYNVLLHNLNPNTKQKKICLTTLKGFQIIPLSEILYCTADGGYTNFILSDNSKICVSKSISEFENMLDDNEFLRIHKSSIVNLDHIKEYRRGDGGSLIMANDYEIEVSRRKKELFLEKAKLKFKLR